MKLAVLVALLLTVRTSFSNLSNVQVNPELVGPVQVSTGWWGGWEFGTFVRLKPTLPDSILVVRGISNDDCMQAVVDSAKRPFRLNYQRVSVDGSQCEERWCIKEPSQSVIWVRVWGSALWFGIRHSVSVTEWPAGSNVSCGADK